MWSRRVDEEASPIGDKLSRQGSGIMHATHSSDHEDLLEVGPPPPCVESYNELNIRQGGFDTRARIAGMFN